MITLEGHYFDGHYPIAIKARMDFEDQAVVMTAGSISQRFDTSQLKVSPRIASAERFINLPKGSQFVCPDQDFLDYLSQESTSEGLVSWLEERWGVAFASVAVIFCILIVGYFFGLPAAAERIAARIPMETEQSLGVHALKWLDEQEWFNQTKLETDVREEIYDGFERLCRDLSLRKYWSLGPAVANAWSIGKTLK